MDVAGTPQARAAAGVSRASRGEPERKIRRNGEIVRDPDVPDIFEKLIEESNESEESQYLVGKDQEQGRNDVRRQPLPPEAVRGDKVPRIDIEA